MSITASRTGTLYAGTALNHTCVIELNTTGVVGDVAVSRAITGLDIDGSRLILTELVETSGVTYETTLMFNPLNTSDSGTYPCTATVNVTGVTTPGQASASEHLQVEGKFVQATSVCMLPVFCAVVYACVCLEAEDK